MEHCIKSSRIFTYCHQIALFIFCHLTLNIGYCSTCENRYSQALKDFENGQIEKVINIVKDCRYEKTNKLNIKIHKLIIDVFLYQEELDSAENYLIYFIKVCPFPINTNMNFSGEFLSLLNKYTVEKKSELNFSIGAYKTTNNNEVYQLGIPNPTISDVHTNIGIEACGYKGYNFTKKSQILISIFSNYHHLAILHNTNNNPVTPSKNINWKINKINLGFNLLYKFKINENISIAPYLGINSLLSHTFKSEKTTIETGILKRNQFRLNNRILITYKPGIMLAYKIKHHQTNDISIFLDSSFQNNHAPANLNYTNIQLSEHININTQTQLKCSLGLLFSKSNYKLIKTQQ